MRAVVTAPFHHPHSGVFHQRGDVLVDADLAQIIKHHPETLHRLTFTDRTPIEHEAPAPAAPPAPPAPAVPVKE